MKFKRQEEKVSERRRILTQEEILQLINKTDCELSDLSDDDNDAKKTKKHESHIPEGESSSDENNEEKHQNI
ncbi:hypothetical protein TNCV_5077031 [Trichonephila clavipes]|uniref:Uncharacterized protein n=1 Tax=Trichonephila clavipes TaxID=2585209 RepID=A0A8X6S3A6_TRICX|nr:hypothetical protein TNCV_5077031 [Trichonephila clavipes]